MVLQPWRYHWKSQHLVSLVRLLESENKTQIVAKHERDRISLQNLYPNWCKDEVTILGVSTTSKRRDLTPKENQRIEDARRRAHLIASAPIHWSLKIRSFQSLVLSKAANGWVGKDPLKKTSEEIFSLLSAAGCKGFKKNVLWIYPVPQHCCTHSKVGADCPEHHQGQSILLME